MAMDCRDNCVPMVQIIDVKINVAKVESLFYEFITQHGLHINNLLPPKSL